MYILAVDLGTTAIKAAVISQEGSVLGKCVKEYALLTPSPLEVELPVNVYWDAFKKSIQEVLGMTKLGPGDIAVLGMSVQGETLVLVDNNGEPIHNAIVWMDNRAQEEAAILDSEFPHKVTYEITGQVSIVPTWPAAKILWIKKHRKDLFQKAHKFLLLEDYFIHRLTGKYVAESSLLSSTVYWNIRTKQWWPEMLARLELEESRLPEIYEPGQVVGPILPEVAREIGLGGSLMITTGALDQAAGAIGVGNIRPGLFSENTGAALAICATLDKPFMDPEFRMPCHYHGIPDLYMAHTFTSGGMVLKWFRDRFCAQEIDVADVLGKDAYALLDDEAANVPPGCGGLVMLPHLEGAMAPEANPKAKGVFFGFTLHHGRAHFIRAALEAIAFIVKRNIDVLTSLKIPVNEVICLGGGAKSRLWNQIKANVLEKKIVTTANDQDAACLGAAFIAGKAVGIYQSLDEAIAGSVSVSSEYVPDSTQREVYAKAYTRYVKLYENLVSVFELP
jgi:sugar (pentulose or hexulose) kinase